LVFVLKLYLSTDFHVLVLVLVLEGDVLVLETKELCTGTGTRYLSLCTCRHAKNHSQSVKIYQWRNFCQS